ncbi:13638_t:CDS:2 [Funneliformis caledonium]|uniref:13638_t:CDS:1 n=1 Tax=Funneliformis caledonium TaxID=1117310 RepID=A0A9N9BVN4_9GLOM|nr:13638_t:CDS:2 [Funneliformis caledonium]
MNKPISKPINIVLFGLTGQGKSSIANMLIQGDIYQKGNKFEINDGAVGATVTINFSSNDDFKVFDTIGVGETVFGRIPHKDAIKDIRNYFTICEEPLNYIAYVKMKGRFTEEDRNMFNLFKEIFEGSEKNFIIIITNSNQKWVEKNAETLKKNFGEDYPIIPETVLQVLSSFQSVENKVSKVIELIPIAGSAYHLISSGVYYKLGKTNVATERLVNGTIGAAMDIASVGALRAGVVAGKVAGKAAGKVVFKAMAKSAAKGAATIAATFAAKSVANESNVFEINDGAIGATITINFSKNDDFMVYDTIGIGETVSGSVPHKKAVKEIRNYFTTCQVPLNYNAHVKMKGRFTEEDRKMFNLFKEIFEGSEKNFIIIITNSDQKWDEKNAETLRKNFGEDYPIIPETVLQVLSSSQMTEDKVAKVIDFVPVAGSAYHLISSGVYYKLGKSNVAKERLINGTIGAAIDIACIGSLRAGVTAGKMVVKSLVKGAAQDTGKGAFKVIVKNAAKTAAKSVAQSSVKEFVRSDK